jgi:hypothetical protein
MPRAGGFHLIPEQVVVQGDEKKLASRGFLVIADMGIMVPYQLVLKP